MPRIRQIQQRYTQGELDPKMIGRSDIDQYYGAAETMTNVFPLPQGGFTRRPGLKYVDEIPNQITRNTGQTITATNGGTAANANDNDIATLVTTTNNISTTNPYVVVHYDLGSSKSIAFIDAMEVSLTAGSSADEFKIQVSTDNTNWTTLTSVPMATTARNKRIRVGASYRYVRFVRIGATDLGTAKVNLGELWVWTDDGTLSDARLVDFVFSTSRTFMLLLTDNNAAIYKDGVLQADAYIPHTSSQLETINWTQSADTLILLHEEVSPRNLVRVSDTDWYGNILLFEYIPKYAFTPSSSNPAATLTPSATTGNITLTAGSGVFSSSDVGQYVSGNAGRARIVAYNSTTVVDAVVEIPFFDTGAIASGSWTLESGYEDVWSSTRGYPGCGVFHEGRLWLAGSTERPSTVWGSRVGLFFDFDPGSLLDDDAIDATLDTGQFNKILNLYSGRVLSIFTTGGEHAVIQSLNEPITPTNFNAKKQTSIGSREGLRVVEAEGGVLYVQREGESVQESVYSDTEQAFISNIVSLISSHLIITPVDFALRKATSTSDGNYLLVVNSDGTLTVGSIQRSQLISAFARQTTDGDFLQCGVDNDDMYFVVERQIGSNTVRYLEVFDFDYTLDCAKRSTSGVPASSFSGFGHLEGEAVKVKIDGEDVIDSTVASGVVDFGDYIVSIQAIDITIATGATSNTATITAVDTSRSAIFYNGFNTTHTGTTQREIWPRVTLTNSTTVTVNRDTSSATHTVTVRGYVVEFSSRTVESVQYGAVTIASGDTSGTASISSIDPNKSIVLHLGSTVTTSSSSVPGALARIELTNSTTVTANRANASTQVVTVGFCAVKFVDSLVSSVQHKSLTLTSSDTSDTDSITSVDASNSMLIYNGATANTSQRSNYFYRGAIASGTAVTFTRSGISSTTRTINYTVLEFASGVLSALRRGTTSLASATSADTTITSVNTSRAFARSTGFSMAVLDANGHYATSKLQSSTSVRAQSNTAGPTVAWEVPEFSAAAATADTYVEVGFDYTPVVKDLPVELAQIGTAHGLKKNISEINLQLYRTKNITVNGRAQTFTGYNEAASNDATNGFTGIKRIKGVLGWNLTAQVTISQNKALPMTVLAQSKKVNM